MFALASTFTPESLHEAAKQTYSEMKLAGYGAVGEFHYLHHQPGGREYADPNLMAKTLAEAAQEVELPIVLIPAAYHRGGWGNGDIEPAGAQERFCDPTIDRFLSRVDALRSWADSQNGVTVGIAAHSVRAVPAAWLRAIAEYSDTNGLVRHVHAHEQPREIEECEAEHGCTPIELLAQTGFLSDRTSVIHGIHVTPNDMRYLADSESTVVSCPTTEGDLGDGYFPALQYMQAGVRIAIGSDSQVIIDPFQELRELETGARRAGQARSALLSHFGDLWSDISRNGARSIGLEPESVGQIEINLDHLSIRDIPRQNVPAALITSASAEIVMPTSSSNKVPTRVASE
jgi:formimidoylglutamate deiminase